MKTTLVQKLNEGFNLKEENITESFDGKKVAEKIFKYFEDNGWFYESNKREISGAKKSIISALKDSSAIDIDELTEEIVWEFSNDGDKEAVRDMLEEAVKKLKL